MTTELTVDEVFDAATNDVAFLNRSSFGLIRVEGSDRVDLLHRMSTNNLLSATPGTCIDTVFTSEKGRIVDFVHALIDETSLLLLTTRGHEERLIEWIGRFTIMEDINLAVQTDSTEMVSFVGPRAKDVAELVFGVTLKPNSFVVQSGRTILFRTGFSTHIVDVLTDVRVRDSWKDSILSGIPQLDNETHEVFRISRGIPGSPELTDEYNPYEVGLRHAISFSKGCYIGQEVIARLETYDKVQRSMSIAVIPVSTAPPPKNSSVVFAGEEIGRLTSVSAASVRGKHVGLAVLKRKVVSTDNHISIVFESNTIEGEVSSIPVNI